MNSQQFLWSDAGIKTGRRIYRWLVIGLFLSYLLSGITIIAPGEVGMIRRFGRWITSDDRILVSQPGLLIACPFPIDRVIRLPIKQEIIAELTQNNFEADHQYQSITGDSNLVETKANLKYRIEQPELYATGFQDPDQMIRQIVQATIASTISSWTIDEVLRLQRSVISCDQATLDRLRIQHGERFDAGLWNVQLSPMVSEVEFEKHLRMNLLDPEHEKVIAEILSQLRQSQSLSNAVLEQAQRRLQQLQIGALLTSLEFHSMQPPSAVRDAFIAVHDARVEQEAWRQEALGEKEQSVIEAEAMAQQAIADSKGKLESRTAQATTEAALFEADLRSFHGDLSAETLKRLRRDAWEQILSQRARVFAVSRVPGVGVLHVTIPSAEKTR